jgi:hypothetical protein
MTLKYVDLKYVSTSLGHLQVTLFFFSCEGSIILRASSFLLLSTSLYTYIIFYFLIFLWCPSSYFLYAAAALCTIWVCCLVGRVRVVTVKQP